MINNIERFLNENLIGIIVLCSILLVIIFMNILANDMEEHIEKVSKECASQGYGIKVYYTNSGDKFYKCNIGGENL